MFQITSADLEPLRSLVLQRARLRRELKTSLLEVLDENFVRIPRLTPRDLEVAGVDGGLGRFLVGGVEAALARAVGAVFRYRDGRLAEYRYVPASRAKTKAVVIPGSLDAAKSDVLVGMERQRLEVELATEIVKIHRPALLILDGSVAPQYAGGYGHRQLEEVYEDLTARYRELYNACAERGVFLAGFVKDSRSNSFVKRITKTVDGRAREAVEMLRDTDVLEWTLPRNQRTKTLRAGSRWGFEFFAFYLRTEGGPVFRVEFTEAGGDPELSAACLGSWISFLCSFNTSLGMPSVLLEADLRARVKGLEVEWIRRQLAGAAGIPERVLRLR
jgi:hypothetical protein